MARSKWDDVQSGATIVSLVAVPLLVAYFGWQIQKNTSAEDVRRDYVQMAIGVLSQTHTDENEALRLWAVKVLEQNSPVPFGTDAKETLLRGVAFIQPRVFQPVMATRLMEAPKPWVKPPENPDVDQLITNYAENLDRSVDNALKLNSLQEYIRRGAKLEAEANAGRDDADQQD